MRLQGFRRFRGRAGIAVAVAAAMLASGCSAWRDVATVPVYELKSRARRNQPEVWEESGRVSIFRVIDSNAPLYDEDSQKLRTLQRGTGHKVAAAPAFIVEVAYLIVVSPALYVSGLFAAPEHFEEEGGMDMSLNTEPQYWQDYPWWFFTRGVYLVDALLYDIPKILFCMPVRAFTAEPFQWQSRIELDPKGSLAPREKSYF